MKSSKPPFLRMSEIHHAVKGGGYPNASYLAARLEVSRRTILRDVDYMRNIFKAPIEYHAVNKGYYYSEPAFLLPVIPFTRGELSALFIAHRALEQYRLPGIDDDFRSAVEKIEENFQIKNDAAVTLANRALDFRTNPFTVPDRDIMETMSDAAVSTRQVEFQYGHGTATEHIICNPVRLINDNGEWYLLAHCPKNQDFRLLVMAHISAPAYTGQTFDPAPEKTVEEFLCGVFGGACGNRAVTVKLALDETAARALLHRQWDQKHSIERNHDNTAVLTLHLNSLEGIKPWILSWTPHIKVLSPRKLQKEIRDILTAAGAAYK